MEFIGSNFCLTLGSWRLRVGFAVEDVDAPTPAPPVRPHHIHAVRDDDYLRREA